MSLGSETLDRAVKGVLDRLLDWRWTREPVRRVGRYVQNRANGDNDAEMASNGEFALIAKLTKLFAGRPVVVFDVGANLGDWTAQIRPGLAPGSSLHAFEAVATVFTQLERNLAALGPGAPIATVNAALSDADGQAEIFVYGELAGSSSLHERDARQLGVDPARREVVRRLRGDTYCSQHSIERIDFLKLDVEGHELAVLRGFARMLGEGRIDSLQFEYGGTWVDARTWLKDAFELLQTHGYAVGKLCPHGVRWYPRYEQRLETFQYANYVAVRPEEWRASLITLR